jgi:CRP-like cAMP-binding protein
MQVLYEQVPKMERFFRLITQRAYSAFQQRMLQNLSMDAEARYLAFRETYPDLDLRIPQKHVASYLGMSAEFLSKIKKRVAQRQQRKQDRQ